MTLGFLFLPQWLGIWELSKLRIQALQFIIAQSSLCSFLSTLTIGINLAHRLLSKFVHIGQSFIKLWSVPWSNIVKRYIPAQILWGRLCTDLTICHTIGWYHLCYVGQKVRRNCCSMTCLKSSVLGFTNLHSSWHVPKILLQQSLRSSHRQRYLINLAQSFLSLPYKACSQVPRECRKIKEN